MHGLSKVRCNMIAQFVKKGNLTLCECCIPMLSVIQQVSKQFVLNCNDLPCANVIWLTKSTAQQAKMIC